MALKKHHRILIGSFTTFIIIYMIINGVLLYFLFLKVIDLQIQQSNFQDNTEKQLLIIKTDLQSKVNDLTSVITLTQQDLKSQISEIKATSSSDFSGIIEQSIPAVVSIRTDISQGTGFIISKDGYIVTNFHILEDVAIIQVVLSNQDKKEAHLIGYSDNYDVALLKITGDHSYLRLGNSDDVSVGEKVIAIGNPLGLQFSASEGIVSGVHRKVSESPGKYIQTDAALNPGNSGGPLIDKSGEVIGINNFKVAGSENLGFALESNDIKFIINEISSKKFNQILIK